MGVVGSMVKSRWHIGGFVVTRLWCMRLSNE